MLGHSREALLLDSKEVSAAELESTVLSSSSRLSDALAVGVPHADGSLLVVLCLVLREGRELGEALVASLKRAVHLQLGEESVPAHLVRVAELPRTHNSKVMRNVVQQLFVHEGFERTELISEIANPSCLLELRAAVDEWRSEQARPVLDEAC